MSEDLTGLVVPRSRGAARVLSPRRVAAALVALAAAAGVAAAPARPEVPLDPETAQCREYGSLHLEVGVWTRGGRREFFAAAWSPGARRKGGLAIFGRATPATTNVDANCRRLPGRVGSSPADLGARIRMGRTNSGLSHFVSAGGRRRAGTPLRQCCTAWFAVPDRWFGVADRPSNLGLDVISRRRGHGLRFRCGDVGRVVVHVHRVLDQLDRPTGSYLSVSAPSRRLLAEARLSASGVSSFRVSRRCDRDRL
jgi:hypothetical protein